MTQSASEAAFMVQLTRDNGRPGIRHHYHADYYAAYVFDPDGINVEVVCQAPT